MVGRTSTYSALNNNLKTTDDEEDETIPLHIYDDQGDVTNESLQHQTARQNERWSNPIKALWKMQKRKAWRGVVALYICACIVVLSVNIGMLIWANSKPTGTYTDARILYAGDCGRTASIDFWAHMAINALSTVLLAGGNYANQILLAPTRESIDLAHSKGRSLDIGIQSFTNWPFIGRANKVVVLLMLLSTIPLHLFYNSIVYSTAPTIDIWSAVVTEDYFEVPQHTSIVANAMPLSNSDWQLAKNDELSIMENMTMSNCWNTFSAARIQDYVGYLIIVNTTSVAANASILQVGTTNLLSYETLDNQGGPPTLIYIEAIPNGTLASREWSPDNDRAWFRPEYCLALRDDALTCTIEVVPVLLAVLIACNISKIIALVFLIWSIKAPLITLGDGIASFMDCSDPSTKHLGPVSAQDFKQQTHKLPKKWENKREWYFAGAAPSRWLGTILSCTVFLDIGLILELIAAKPGAISFAEQWSSGFGTIVQGMQSPLRLGLIGDILVVNSPQLILSLLYVFYNALATSLLLTREWTDYSIRHKGLRVTYPTGNQRSSYFLSLPFRFSIPLAAMSAALHWMLSQTLFLEQLDDWVTEPGSRVAHMSLYGGQGIHAMGYSTLALAILLGIGSVLTFGMLGFGFWKYKAGMPIARTHSSAIGAACHLSGDPTKKVRYGVVEGNHVGFSNGSVMPLIDGEYYK